MAELLKTTLPAAPSGLELHLEQDQAFAPPAMNDRPEFLHPLRRRRDRLAATFDVIMILTLKLGVLLHQILQESKRPRVGRVDLGCDHEGARCLVTVALGCQRNSEVLERVRTLGIDFSTTKADRLAYRDESPNHAMVILAVDTTSAGGRSDAGSDDISAADISATVLLPSIRRQTA